MPTCLQFYSPLSYLYQHLFSLKKNSHLSFFLLWKFFMVFVLFCFVLFFLLIVQSCVIYFLRETQVCIVTPVVTRTAHGAEGLAAQIYKVFRFVLSNFPKNSYHCSLLPLLQSTELTFSQKFSHIFTISYNLIIKKKQLIATHILREMCT